MHQHRSGKLKQSNKKHKVSFASKRALKRSAGGRVERGGSVRRTSVKASSKKGLSKLRRENIAKQKRDAQRHRLMVERKVGTAFDAPMNVLFLGLDALADVNAVRDSLCRLSGNKVQTFEATQHVGVVFQKPQKKRFMFMNVERSMNAMLDASKVADYIILVLRASAGEEDFIDEFADKFLTCLRAQGMPTVMGVVRGLRELKKKRAGEMRKLAHRFFETDFTKETPVVESENPFQLLRALMSRHPQTIHWRQMRSYMIAHKIQIVEQNATTRRLSVKVEGYLRGSPMDPEAPVHLTGVSGGDGGCGDGFGTYLLRSIKCAADSLSTRRHVLGPQGLETIYERGSESAEEISKLVRAEAEVDILANGDQTWPTEYEMSGGGDAASATKSRATDEDDGASSAMMEMEVGADANDDANAEDDDEDVEHLWMLATGGKNKDETDDGMADDEDDADAERRALIEAEREEIEFPDEVVTPRDFPARERFARYRGLKSFRTSPWDPMESLPRDYSRLFRFEGGFGHLQRDTERLCKGLSASMRQTISSSASTRTSSAGCDMDQASTIGTVTARCQELLEKRVMPGMCVSMVIGDISIESASLLFAIIANARRHPLVLSSLLPHEQRLSVLHWNAKRVKTFDEPLKSKQPLVFHCGFRRFRVRPTFSERDGAKATEVKDAKFKFCRFFPQNDFAAVSAFGPVTYAPAPLLMFKDDGTLVGLGSLMGGGRGVDPDRIILKRIILTGYPSRVHKHNATVVQMFFNPEDINWFKPVELRTKYGLSGHIKDSIGTHGHMKCLFNKPITQNDTVCLNLYKRCYPKWVGNKANDDGKEEENDDDAASI